MHRASGLGLAGQLCSRGWSAYFVAHGLMLFSAAQGDAQPSKSVEVWEESDVKEVCPRPAQPGPCRAPSQSDRERTSSSCWRTEHHSPVRARGIGPFVEPGGARCRTSRGDFPAAPRHRRVGQKETRGAPAEGPRCSCKEGCPSAEKSLCQ